MIDRPVLAFATTLWRLVRPHRLRAGLILGCLLGEMAFQASLPLSFKVMVDRVLIGRETGLLAWILLLMAGAAVSISLVGLARDRLAAFLVADAMGSLRGTLFAHLQRLPLRYFGKTSAGETVSRFSSDLATVEQALSSAIPWALLPGLEVVANTTLLFLLDPLLALVAVLVFPLSLLGPRWLAPKTTSLSYQRKIIESQAIAVVQENVDAQAVVKAFGLEDQAKERFGRANQQLVECGGQVGFLGALVERSATVSIYLLQVAVLGFGAWRAMNHQMTVGSLAAFQSLFLSLSYSLSYVTQYVPSLLQGAGAMQHIRELLAEFPAPEDDSGARPLPRLHTEIAFRLVSFGYREPHLDLHDLSVSFQAGTRVALVGSSGSGKSTVLGLLLRFFEPSRGSIEFDGRDIRHTTLQSLRAQCAVVLQENVLFDISILENIRLGKPSATDAEVFQAARAAEIHDAVMEMPDGYQTIVGNRGGSLSGGQRQRIALARALIRDPAVLVLDEATSALDPGVESLVNQTLARISAERTVISVTHRLASAVDYDRVIVLERGRVVEDGTHASLVAQRGHYARLWQKQNGFRVSDDGGTAEIQPEKLADLPMLHRLSPEQRDAAARLFHTERLSARRLVFAQGDPADRFYLIVRGEVGVYRSSRSDDGKEDPIAVLETGDCFGEVALLRNRPRNATVRTLTPVVLLALHRDAFSQLLAQTPSLRFELEQLADARAVDTPTA